MSIQLFLKGFLHSISAA
ncbi:lactocin 705-alpha family bacteriocin [Bacillus sp. AK031]